MVNVNVAHHCYHDLVGAAQGVHVDAGLNDEQMQASQDDLEVHELEEDMEGDLQDWFQDDDVAPHIANVHPAQHPDQPQDSIFFYESGSIALYLRAHGLDIVLRVDDILARNLGLISSSSSSSSSDSEVQSVPSFIFQIEEQAFKLLQLKLATRPCYLPLFRMPACPP